MDKRYVYKNKDKPDRLMYFSFFWAGGYSVIATFLTILALFNKIEFMDLEYILGAIFTYSFSMRAYYSLNNYRPIQVFDHGIKIKVFLGIFAPITIYWEDIHSFSYFNQTDAYGIQIYYLTLKNEKKIFLWRIRGLRISSSMIKFEEFEELINHKIGLLVGV